MTSLRALAIASCMLIGVRSASAQSRCRSADAETAMRIGVTLRMMHPSDGRWTSLRQAYNLPVVPDSSIAVATDSVTCSQAADAFNAALPDEFKQTARSAYVVRVGPTRLLVWDPTPHTETSGEFDVIMVLDGTTYAVLAKFSM